MFRIARPARWLLYCPSPTIRAFTATPGVFMDNRKVNELLKPLSQKYSDAKDEYEIATESLGTTYAKEDIASAKELMREVVREYESILNSESIGEEEKRLVRERVGQRVRELVGAVEENLKEHDQ